VLIIRLLPLLLCHANGLQRDESMLPLGRSRAPLEPHTTDER
jgi:hypothetical protein